MKITNPTKEKIEVQIKGVHYEIEPEGSISNIPEDIARFWQEHTHKFIQLRKDKLEEVKKEEEIVVSPQPTSTPELSEDKSDEVPLKENSEEEETKLEEEEEKVVEEKEEE